MSEEQQMHKEECQANLFEDWLRGQSDMLLIRIFANQVGFICRLVIGSSRMKCLTYEERKSIKKMITERNYTGKGIAEFEDVRNQV